MRLLTAVCIAIMLFYIPTAASEIDTSIIEKQFDASGAATLEDGSNPARAFDEQFSFKAVTTDLAGGKFPFTPKGILQRIMDILMGEVKTCASGGAQIIFAAIVLGLLSHFSLSPKGVFDISFYVCYAVIIGIALRVFFDAAQVGKSAIGDMVLFMKSAVPVMAVLSVSTGNPARAAISTIALQGIHLTAWLIEGIFVPIAYITAALCAVGNLSKDFSLKGFVDLAKKVATWGICFVLTLFSSIMLAQGMVASALDNVTGKAVKYAMGNFIPVVGGILSDSLETITACGVVLKNAVGVAGIIAVAVICLTPILKLIAMIIIMKLAGAAAGLVSDSRLSDVIGDFAGLLAVVEAMVIGVCLMFIVALAIMATGSGMAPAF